MGKDINLQIQAPTETTPLVPGIYPSPKSETPTHAIASEILNQPGQLEVRKGNTDNRLVHIAIVVSLIVNVILFLAKIAALVISGSLSVLASLLDSALDLTSQAVLWYSNKHAERRAHDYPAGKSRLSPLGILICATLMFAGAVEVIRQSVVTITGGLEGHLPTIDFSLIPILTLAIATSLKLGLYCICRFGRSIRSDPSIATLRQDHRNDIFSNIAAMVAGWITYNFPILWWLDAGAAIGLSLYIAWSWYENGREVLQQLVGAEADTEQMAEIYEITDAFKEKGVDVDWLRAYHLGHDVVVEVEIVMAPDAPLTLTHDTSLQMQQEIEQLDYVERAYVHVDYAHRDYDEHKKHSFYKSSFVV
eukprot:TRINITY_DN66445_c9_g13_i1.p1 TRINITY_DN66445_c9_g13~~TRINITY_DN66445_c9_g13_i1.p1  ORF type:complete len:363 (-),score=2.36 TRINITY_DN66445_c9_g13_i1:85-1173(-)